MSVQRQDSGITLTAVTKEVWNAAKGKGIRKDTAMRLLFGYMGGKACVQQVRGNSRHLSGCRLQEPQADDLVPYARRQVGMVRR